MGQVRGLHSPGMSRLHLGRRGHLERLPRRQADSLENYAILKDWETLPHQGLVKEMGGAIWPGLHMGLLSEDMSGHV